MAGTAAHHQRPVASTNLCKFPLHKTSYLAFFLFSKVEDPVVRVVEPPRAKTGSQKSSMGHDCDDLFWSIPQEVSCGNATLCQAFSRALVNSVSCRISGIYSRPLDGLISARYERKARNPSDCTYVELWPFLLHLWNRRPSITGFSRILLEFGTQYHGYSLLHQPAECLL